MRKYIGAYYVDLGGKADALIFTGGIGQNSPVIRQRICRGLESIGLAIDRKENRKLHSGKSGWFSTGESKLGAVVLPSNEELLIARDTLRVVKNVPRRW